MKNFTRFGLATLALLISAVAFGQSYDVYDQVRTDDSYTQDVTHQGPIKEVNQGDITPGLDYPVVIDFEGLKDDEFGFASRGNIELTNSTTEISLDVYPNPTSDILVLELTSLEQGANVYIVDLSGRLIELIEIERSSNQTNFRLNIASWSAGMYFVMYEKGANREIVRFEKV